MVIGALLDSARRPLAALLALCTLAAVVAAVLISERPPDPVPASAPAPEFSAQRALDRLGQFATAPRPLGSPASNRTREFLARTLRAEGFTVRVEPGIGSFTAEGTAAFGRVENVVAMLPGRNSTGTVVLAAHYDSVVGGPGASDDGAAVAAMLESVRALRGQLPLRNDLVLLFTDGEESGLLGAAAYIRSHPSSGSPTVVLNWEARGVSGPSLMFETSRDNAALVRLFASAAPHPHGDSSMVEFYRMLPNNTDFTEFASAGFTGMNFAYIGGADRYHTPGDTIANIDLASLQNHGANMLGLTRALGNRDLATLAADHDAAYLTLLGRVLVYPATLMWPLALLAVAALVALLALARRRRLLSIPRFLAGIGCALLPLATAGLLAEGLRRVLVSSRPHYADVAFLHRPQLYELSVAALAALAVLVWYLLLRRRVGPAALALGALAWLVALGVLTARWAPGASQLFALPALAWTLAGLLALLVRRVGWVASALVMTAGAVPAAVLLLPLALGTFQAGGLALVAGAAVLLALFGLTLLPLLELGLSPLGRPAGWRPAVLLPATALALAVALAAAGVHVDRTDAARPRSADLTYLLDADTGRASWVSRDASPAPWARQYVLDRVPGAEGSVAALAEGPVWVGPAPVVPAPPPLLVVRGHRGDSLDLHLVSSRAARTVTLLVGHRVDEVTVAAPGRSAARVTTAGTRPGPWPTEIRIGDLPREGVDIALRVRGAGALRVLALDLTHGLDGIRTFTPRPAELERSRRPDGDAVVVSRSYRF